MTDSRDKETLIELVFLVSVATVTWVWAVKIAADQDSGKEGDKKFVNTQTAEFIEYAKI